MQPDAPNKTCGRCGNPNPTRQTYCPPCKRDYDRKHWAGLEDERRARVMAVKAERRRRIGEQMYAYLVAHPCVDCGETDVIVLDFDHVRGEKVREVSDMVRRGLAWTKIMEEATKCEVVCANDHRRRTARRAGWDRQHQVVV